MITINSVSDLGGSVELNKEHHVNCSYAAGVKAGDNQPPLLYTWIMLPNGRYIQMFVNRETGLITVDIVSQSGDKGNEVLRLNANKVKLGDE